jgi:spermidine synthase
MNPIWLRREGDHAIVSVEIDGQWIEVIREFIPSPFSHIWEGNDPRLTETVTGAP